MHTKNDVCALIVQFVLHMMLSVCNKNANVLQIDFLCNVFICYFLMCVKYVFDFFLSLLCLIFGSCVELGVLLD